MKVNCPKCRKQFVLPLRTAGKLLKVRCTSCGFMFLVRVRARASDSTAPKGGKAKAVVNRIAPAQPVQSAPSLAAQGEPAPSVDIAPAQPAQSPPSLAAQGEPAPSVDVAPAQPAQSPSSQPMQARPSQLPRIAPVRTEPQRGVPGESVFRRYKYYALIAGKTLGPMPFAALRRLVAEKKITGRHLVWRRGLAEWVPVSRLEEIAELFGSERLPLRAEPAPLRAIARPKEAATLAAQPDAPVVSPPAQSETTEGEVILDRFDHDFFAAGELEQVGVERGAESIEIVTEPMFPTGADDERKEKHTRDRLRDFSVMVRLSRESKRKTVALLTGLAAALVLALALIFTLGDPLAVVFPQKEVVDYTPEAPNLFLVERNQGAGKKRPKKQKGALPAEPATKVSKVDPGPLLTSIHGQERFLSLDFEAAGVDKEQLAERIRKEEKLRLSRGSSAAGKKKAERTRGEVHEEEELTLGALALAEQELEAPKIGGIGIAGPGTSEKSEVVDTLDSAMGTLSGPYKLEERRVSAKVFERPGDGVMLKALVADKIARKIRGDKARLQRCVDIHGGVGGLLKASLHFREDGTVERVSVKGGTPGLEKCFVMVLDGWRVREVNKKLRVPISIQFQ